MYRTNRTLVNAIKILDSLAVMLIHVFNGYNLMVEKLQLRGKSKWRTLGDIHNGSKDYRREPDKHVYLHVSYFP